ncbi:Leucine-rich repeats protein [Rhizoctonia solani]|uniref:Leucine-rich repeats protein n=1 Tax=Rhizoctonia solani TaxID=456999 RepID=A0A8H7IFZ0_9AGAM|nr:Leucine-rich repeats protein [Rhizoctonia solani]
MSIVVETEAGDDYVRRWATFIRTHEQRLAGAGYGRRPNGSQQPSALPNLLSWVGLASAPDPGMVLTTDLHHIFYLLMRFEAWSSPIHSSSSAMSTMSRLSLGGSWWSRSEPPPVDAELKYIYSSFTKLPALSIKQAGLKLIAELAQDPLTDQRTYRTSLSTVVDDRSDERASPPGAPPSYLPPFPKIPYQNLPNQIQRTMVFPTHHIATQWSRLRRLSFADNGLTFFPTAPLANLVNVTHLDLSSNLLVAVPSGLGALYNLVSLNLSDNMIESVLGIYATLGSITNLDLSKNRLESLCGLERLRALERVDLRLNHVEESAEVGRLVGLPNILNISIQGNPFTENEEEYRARCFEYFLKEGKSITLDGTPLASMNDVVLRYRGPSPLLLNPHQRRVPMSLRLWTEASATSKEQANTDIDHTEPLSSFSPPPMTAAAVSPKPVIHHHNKPRKRKPTRIVDLDDIGESSGTSVVHSRETSNEILSHSPQSISLLGTGTSPKLSSSPGSIHRSRERGQRPTPHAMPSTIREETEPPTPCIEVKPKAAKRRARASASVYEPGPTVTDEQRFDDAEAFRRKMEALRAEVGDGWLKVLSQQQQGGIA